MIALDRSPELVGEIDALARGDTREVFVPALGGLTVPAILRPPAAAPKLTAVVGDALNLPFCDNTFDCVVSRGTLDRVNEPRRLILEVERILVPGGFAVIACLHDWLNASEPSDPIR